MMGHGRLKSEWAHTSNLMALIANTNRDPKKKPFKASEFDPYASERKAQARKEVIPKVRMKDLKGLEIGLRLLTSKKR